MGKKAGLLSTVCNYIDEERCPSTHTTPDALEINSFMRRMVDAGCEYCFMEVSSHAVHQKRIAGLDFDGAVFSNITHDHWIIIRHSGLISKRKRRFLTV